MAGMSKTPERGSGSFHMSTKVYYQPRNDPTLPEAEKQARYVGDPLRPVQILQSATDRSLVPIGEFDALPIAETASPTQLFCFESRKGTDIFNEVPNDAMQLKSGKKGAQKVSFNSSDLIDSEDVLRLECLQGGAFKMFIPASPELERPPLCFEIKPPANVILDLPQCDKKPNIKVVVTTICSTGDPNEKASYRTEGGMDVETSNLDDPEIEELIRELCQVIVETHKKEESSPPRKKVKEPPQVVELYKRKIMSREPNALGEYITYTNAESITNNPFTYEYDDSGYFYFQPQNEPRESSVSLLDKICSCLGRTFGLIPSDSNIRRQAPMKMEVDNDPEEGYVRCLLMGKTPFADDDDCTCDQQPVAEIRNSAELMDKQSPLVDRIMYLLRKSVSHKYSSEELVDGGGYGDFNNRGYGNNDDGSAGVKGEKTDVNVDNKAASKGSHGKHNGTKHHTRFRTDSNKELEEELCEEEEDDEKKKKTGKKKLGKLLCCTHTDDGYDKLAHSENHQHNLENIGVEDDFKALEDDQKRSEKRKKRAEKMQNDDKSQASVENTKPPNLDGPNRHPNRQPSTSIEDIDPCVENCKMAKKLRKPEKVEVEIPADETVEKPKPPQPEKSIKRSPFRRNSSKGDIGKVAEEGKKGKNKKKDKKSSEDESDSSKKSKKKEKKEKKEKKKKEREESRERSKDNERRKMIGHRDKAYWASYRRLRRRQMDKPETQFKESVVSANISVDALKMVSNSSSDSDSLIVDIESDIAMHEKKKKHREISGFELSGKRRSYVKRRAYKPVSDGSSDSSLDVKPAKSVKVEISRQRNGDVESEVSKTSSKSKYDRKLSNETPSGASCSELPSQKTRVVKQRKAFKDVLERFKTLRKSKSSTKSLGEEEGVDPPHKKSQTGHRHQKQKEDEEKKITSESPKKIDYNADPRNISAVMEAQALKDAFEKSHLPTKGERADVTNSQRNPNSNDITNTENASTINLVIPCGTYPSEEADLIGLSSWKNPITKSTTAIDSKCDSLCMKCSQSITPSPTNSQTRETSSPTTSISSRKSILVDRRQSTSIPRCSTSVYSMREVTLSGSSVGTIFPSVASLDSKLRQREKLERFAHLESPTDFISLPPETDSSNQTLSSSSSAVTNNSSSVEVETKSTNFDSGTSVVSNVTIDSTLSQNPFNTAEEMKDTTRKSYTAFKAPELSTTTVDTWSNTSSTSDIQGNRSPTSTYQETTSANCLASGLSSDGSRSLIDSMIESLPSDLKCDDGSLSLLGESSGDSRSTVALSASSAIDSALSMSSQATSESIQAQDSLISRDIMASDSISFPSRDSYQNDSRSRESYNASETGSQALNAEQLNRGASKSSIFSEMRNSCLSESAIAIRPPRNISENSTASVSGSTAPLIKGASQRSISFPSENPAVMKIQSVDTVLASKSNTDALIVSPSKVASTGSINRAKQICMQVPDIGPTFTNAMISSSASVPGANESTSRADSDHGSSVESVVEIESVERETAPERTDFEKISNVDEHESCCPMIPIVSDENLLKDENNENISDEKLDIESEKLSAENLELLPQEKLPNETAIVEELVKNMDNSNEVQPKKKKISRRKHIMATFLCISKPCRNVRESESFAPYRPAPTTSGLDGARNLSDTIPQIVRHPPSQPHRSKRTLSDHPKSKKATPLEKPLTDDKHRRGSEEVKLKSILSKTLHKDNRFKLTKKVSFSPNPSFIEAATTPDASTSRTPSENESEIQTSTALSKLRAFGLRSPSCESIVPLMPNTEDFRKAKTLPNLQTSLIRTKESFGSETNRDLRPRDERSSEDSQSDDSDACSSREDEDDSYFETNSGKSQESFQARLQLSNLMCESIPPKSSEVSLSCLDHLEQGAEVDSCGLTLTSGSEESFTDKPAIKTDERILDNDHDDRYSKNISSPIVKESKMCLGEKYKLFSKSKSKEINFLKDCPIGYEEAELEKQNSARKLLKKRQLFAQKVSSLIKVTQLNDCEENLAISNYDRTEREEKKAKKSEKNTSKTSHKYEDRSPGQRGVPKNRTENDRQRKPSR